MALDGTVISNLVYELDKTLTGGRITKVSQPERDELLLTIKNYDSYKLYISASASLPLCYLTENSKPAPITAPAFCMLLRKHFNSARIVSITQPGLERIIRMEIEHLDELGDLRKKYLVIELMGKHSNIILTDDEDTILDSIKRINGFVSSVREVLPGRKYFIPETSEKLNPAEVNFDAFSGALLSVPEAVSKALYLKFTGLSPVTANEICHRAKVSPELPFSAFRSDEAGRLFESFSEIMGYIRNKNYSPVIIFKDGEPKEFSSFALTLYSDFEGYESKSLESISALLEKYYSEKNASTRIRQKSADLRKLLSTVTERAHKKYQLQLKQLSDTEGRDKYRIYGELINTYGHSIPDGSKELTCINYYDGKEITIPLDDAIPVQKNAVKYFDKYTKQKRTAEATEKFLEETKEELSQLDSIKTNLELSTSENDLNAVREELSEFGYIKGSHGPKGTKAPGKAKQLGLKRTTYKPYRYVTAEGYEIYVGRNNYQNDELTFKFASGGDWWFHAKGVPGSHVILKSKGEEIPDRVFEAAAALAAYYSKNRDSSKVEIDYLERKNVKKPAGARPGFVVYYTNYSMVAETSLITDETKREQTFSEAEL